MPNLSRRGFMVLSAAGIAARGVPRMAGPTGRRVLTLVYDKALGAMRAVDRLIP